MRMETLTIHIYENILLFVFIDIMKAYFCLILIQELEIFSSIYFSNCIITLMLYKYHIIESKIDYCYFL